MATRIEELEATIRELRSEVGAATSTAEDRQRLEAQIANLDSVMTMLREALPSMEEMKKYRAPLGPDVLTFFTPEAAATIPIWLPDSVGRRDIAESSMRCQDGARVYFEERSVSCAIPGVPGQHLAVAHGLGLQFRPSGRLASQSFYDRGRLRWSVTYFVTGGRETSGAWASTEPKEYIEHGLHTTYAANGTPIVQAWWNQGAKHGWDKKWEDDGYPIGATLFEDGREVEQILADGSRARA